MIGSDAVHLQPGAAFGIAGRETRALAGRSDLPAGTFLPVGPPIPGAAKVAAAPTTSNRERAPTGINICRIVITPLA